MQGVLINIFGGIVRCDMIAEAIIAAVKEVNVTVPVVVRLEGNNAEAGAKLLDESGLKLTAAQGLNDAAEKSSLPSTPDVERGRRRRACAGCLLLR